MMVLMMMIMRSRPAVTPYVYDHASLCTPFILLRVVHLNSSVAVDVCDSCVLWNCDIWKCLEILFYG